MSSERFLIGQSGKFHKLDAPKKHAGLPTVPYVDRGSRRNNGEDIFRLGPRSAEPKSSNLKLPRTLAASKGCLILMPEPENGWLFGEQSSAFKTTRWTKRKNTEPVSKETLKALTATILEYGPDAKHFVDFLQSFAKSNDVDLLSKPGSRPNDYLKGLQKQLGENFRYSFQNLQLDVDELAARTPNVFGRLSSLNSTGAKVRDDDNMSVPSSDFSSADTFYKNCTLFIPQQLAEGSQFMSKLHLKDGEVVKYPISAGEMLGKLLFQDSPEELERRAFDERYELSSGMPDVSILSTLPKRKGAVRFDPDSSQYKDRDLSSPWGIDAAVHGSLTSKDREDGASSAPLYREKGEGQDEASEDSSSGPKSDKYANGGYLKRARKKQTVLLRNRNNLNLSEAVKEMIQEKVKLQPIYEYNYQVDKTKNVSLIRKDAEDLVEYVTQWTKEQNEKAIEEAKRMMANDDSSDEDYSEGNRSHDRRSKSAGSKSSVKEDTGDREQFRDNLLKSLRVKSPKKKKSEEPHDSTAAKTLVSDDSDEESYKVAYNCMDANDKYDLKLYESTNRASRTVVQPKTERTLTSSKMVKPKKKKSPVEKIQNLQATKKEDPTAELTISEKIVKYSAEKQQKILDLELKQETLELEIRTLKAELEKTVLEIDELDKLIASTERDLTDNERDTHELLNQELEERLEVCRFRLEAETKSLWHLRRERALIERQMLFDDLEDDAKREEFSASQEIELEEREITEESEMEENWERLRKKILEDYEKQRTDLESSLTSTRIGKMTPLSYRRTSLEEKRLDLSKTIESLQRKRDSIVEEMSKVNEWYEQQLQQLKQELDSQMNLHNNVDPNFASVNQPRSAAELALEKAISDQKRENMYRDRLRQSKSSKVSKAFIYSYFSHIPNKMWMKPMTKEWAKMIQTPSYSSATPSAKGKGAPAPGGLKRSKTNKF